VRNIHDAGHESPLILWKFALNALKIHNSRSSYLHTPTRPIKLPDLGRTASEWEFNISKTKLKQYEFIIAEKTE